MSDLVRTADIKKTYTNGGSTNWSNKLYKGTEFVKDTMPSYKNDHVSRKI